MQLHYNILWLDNDIQEYIDIGDVKSIEDFLLELGFEPTIITVDDEANLDEYISVYQYDLIISDYNLNATTGDNIIESIRTENKLSTEILFYSAKDNFKEIQAVKDKLAFIERLTFHTARDTLLDKIEILIQLTLSKLLEINATRGLITAATSELDVTIEDITLHLVHNVLNKNTDELDDIVKNYATDFLDKSSENFIKKHKQNGFDNTIKVIESNRKWGIFRELLKEYGRQHSEEIISKFIIENATYFDQVINIRNKFAHARSEEVEGMTVLKGQYASQDFEYDKVACINIRKNLIHHKNNFNLLLNHFGINDTIP